MGKGYNSTCRDCGRSIHCPGCEATVNQISLNVDKLKARIPKHIKMKNTYMKYWLDVDVDNLPAGILLKVVRPDRISMFTSDQDYRLTYSTGNIVKGIHNSFGVSCFTSLDHVKTFLDNNSEHTSYRRAGDSIGKMIKENRYLLILVRGIGVRHGSIDEADHGTVHLDKFYASHPPKLYNWLFVGMSSDDIDIGYTPKGTDWYHSVEVLT